MNVTIVAVDKMRESYLRAGCELYAKRLAPYGDVAFVEIRPASGKDALATESRDMLAKIADGAAFWALDRRGTSLTSEELAAKIAELERSGTRRLVLGIGGPEGLSESVLARAHFTWSLSPLTYLHEMSRLIVLEQLYRAAKINRGEPYHR